MEPSQSQVLPEPLLAAMPQLKEKPCQGVRTWNPALHPGQFIGNSRTAIGLRFGCLETASDPVVAPSNGTPTISRQACLAQFNNSSFGKVVNFFSLASPFIGPDRLQSAVEDVGGTGLKFAAYSFFKTASSTMVRTPFGSMSGLVAGTIETVAKDVVAPVAAVATGVQVMDHLLCAGYSNPSVAPYLPPTF